MLFEFIFGGLMIIGNVDHINDSFAVVEYSIEEKLYYKVVVVDKDMCNPYEGQRVIFNDKKIIGCIDE